MMKTLVLLALLTLPACSRHSAPYTEGDVRKFVLPGTTREAIIKRFGEPTSVEKNPRFDDGSTNVDEIIYYFLPLSSWPRTGGDQRFTGFQVSLKDGKTIDWLPSR
jgi:hypothetical protein